MEQGARVKRDVSGLALIDKPAGWTSAKAVYTLRSRIKAKSAGHSGTLDPLATGLLQVFFGESTKVIPYLEGEKEYEARALFGLETDSHDMDGKVLREVPVGTLDRDALEKGLARFQGKTSQVPPQISAARFQGERAYKLSRQGVEVPLKPKEVEIKEIALTSLEGPRMGFRVVCSRGTYLRSIVRDLGESIGVPAVLESIRRVRIGSMRVEEALSPDEAAAAPLRPARDALMHLKGLLIGEGAARRVRQGQALVRGEYQPVGEPPRGGDYVRLETKEKELVAVAHFHADGYVRMKRVFH